MSFLKFVKRMADTVERIYCKRPILCLSSSKILTPHPPHRPASVYQPPLVRGRTHSLGGEGGGGSIFWKMRDTALHSTYVSTLWLIQLEDRSQRTTISKEDLVLFAPFGHFSSFVKWQTIIWDCQGRRK